MKKLFLILMVMVLALSLAACGGGDAPASAPSNQSPEDQVAAEQALADVDYAQLHELLTVLNQHIAMNDEMSAIREQVINGQAEESVLLDATKQMADHSQALLQAVQSAQWKTEYYKEHVALLTASVEALAQGEMLAYEAGVENDESKLSTVAELMTEYDTKLSELLDLMGV